MNDATISTLIVDDQPDIRLLVRMAIEEANGELRVSGEAADGPEALDLFPELTPDVVLLDQMMPGMTGLAVAERIRQVAPDQAVLLFSAYLDDELRERARSLGIDCCLDKDDLARLPEAIRAVAGGRRCDR